MKENKVLKIKTKNMAKADLWILVIVLAITIFGVIMVYSASYYSSLSENGNPYTYFIKQVGFVITGLLLLILFWKIDYHKLIKLFWIPAYILGLGLLVALLIPGIGTNAYGATRWIYIGPMSIMPGEIAKPCLVLFLTGFFSKYRENTTSFVKCALPAGIASGIYFLLIMKQPNMSTACTVLFIAAAMLIVAGMKMWQFSLCAVLGTGGAIGYIVTSEYRMRRVTGFLDPFAEDVRLDEGWNAVQSLLALGTGGVFGKGLGNSVQKNLYLPMPHNDFILAVIGEELGFVGIFILMAAYLWLFYKGFLVSVRAKDFEGMMLSFAITFWIAIQTIVHFAVVTSSMPATGIVLPFISYGGNAMWIFMAVTGILLNISKQANEARLG